MQMLLVDRPTRDLGVVALVPGDRQRVERGLGVPPGVGDHRDRGLLHLDDLLHARHFRDLRLVEAHDLGAEHRRILDGGVEHAGQLHVDRVDLRAVQLVGGVEPLQRLAGDLPALRVLQRDGLRIRRRELGGGRRHLAVAGFSLRGRVRDDAVRHGHLADRHLPLVGRGLQQHDARRRSAPAHVVLRDADAARAAGAHLAPGALAGEIARRADALGLHLLPVAFELFGDQLGEPGERALAHLGTRDADHAAVVRLDRDPDVDFRCAVLRQRFADERRLEAEREPAGRERRGADDEFAAGETLAVSKDHLFHGCLLTTGAWRGRRRGYYPPPDGRLRECAGRCRIGRYWSSPRRCRHRSASASSSTAPPPP